MATDSTSGAGPLAVTVDPSAVPPSPAVAGTPAPPGYELLEEIGRGGMGVVYKARQTQLGRVVALKMILAGGHASEDARRRFLGEAEAIARVKHPGIVQIFDYGTHAGLPFYSLEFCPGGSLARHLSGRPISPPDAARTVAAVARAVQAAHARGIIHRDIKPGNVMIAEDGSMRVADYGLAKGEEAGLTATGAVVGTPSYMAPEQAAGGKGVGPAADVYALGAVLYECLTGRPPFRAATATETLMQVMRDEPAGARRLNATVPVDLETVCHKCLHKEPARRYASAAELADDLEHWLAGRPVKARPVGRLERLWRWARREPGTAALVGAVALLLVAGTAVAWGLAAWALGEKGRADRKAEEAEANARQAQAARHAIQCDLAMRSLAQNDVGGAERVLGAMAPRFEEAWETRYIRGTCRARALVLPANRGFAVRALSWSPDGTRLACSGDKAVVLWDTRAGRPARSLEGHREVVNSVAWGPDGRRVVSCGNGGSVKIWDTAAGREAAALKGHAKNASAVAYSPDGTLVASGDEDGTVKVWDASTGEERFSPRGHSDRVAGLVFSPDGSRLASASHDSTLMVWDTASGREAFTIKGHGESVHGVAWSPDGGRIASASGDKSIKVWDARTGAPRQTLTGHEDGVWAVSWSPDGTRLASGSWDRTVKVWAADTGKLLLSMKGEDSYIEAVAWSPDGRRIAAGGWGETVRIWDTATGREALSLAEFALDVSAAALSPDGTRIASGGKGLKVWDVAGRVSRLFGGPEPSVGAVAWSPDGGRLASAGDKLVRLWDARTGAEARALSGHAGFVHCLTWSPDGARVVSGGADKTLIVWDAVTGEALLTLAGHEEGVSGAAWSPDGRWIASCGADENVIVWDAATGGPARTLRGHKSLVYGVAFSPDSRRLVSGGADKVLKVWDAGTGEQLLALAGHTEAIKCVAWAPVGGRIVSGGADKVLKVWDSETGQEKLTAGHARALFALTWSADGDRLLSASDDSLARIHDAAGPTPVGDATYHAAEAGEAEKGRQWFAAAFHLERLHRLAPLDAATRLRLAIALRQCPRHPGADAVRRRHDAFNAARRAAPPR